MINRRNGFTLLELLIALTIVAIIAAMNSQLLQQMIFGSRQQERVSSVQFESALGLEVMRQDIMEAGFGLTDTFQVNFSPVYTEAAFAPASTYNDSPTVRTIGPPSPISFGNNVSNYVPNSDYLVIRSPAVGNDNACGKWTYIDINDPNIIHQWNAVSSDMQNGYNMIVVQPRTTTSSQSVLVMKASNNFTAVYHPGGAGLDAAYTPSYDTRYIAYGINDGSTAVVRPFNRVDYYVRRTPTTSPACAPNTGTLIKGVLDNGGAIQETPLVDCVGNMQVLFGIDANNDGYINPTTEIKQVPGGGTLKLVKVYLLAHEGTLDAGFTYQGGNNILVGDPNVAAPNNGLTVDLNGLVGANWSHYRWKVYSITTKMREF